VPGNPTTIPVVDGDYTKRVKVVLSDLEMNGDNITLIASDAAGSEWCDLTINIQTSANQIDDIPTTAISVADIIAGITDGTLDLQEMLRIIVSVCAGLSSGGGTTELKFRNSGDSKNRIVATVDANGNRTAITLDGS